MKVKCLKGVWLKHCFSQIDTVAFSNSHFGAGIGDIYLDNVGCIGNESSLLDCSYVSNAGCSHSEDAGVRCQCKITLTNE